MERGARIGEVGARGFERAMLGVDQVDLRNAGRARQDCRGRDSPSRSRNRRRGRKDRRAGARRAGRSRRRSGPSRRCRAGSATSRRPPAAARRGRASSRAAAVSPRFSQKTRQWNFDREPSRPNALADMLLQARRAIVVGAGANKRAAVGEQCPAAGDVGEVLFLVLGQQHLAELIGAVSRCAGRPASPPASGDRYRAETIARRRCP